jgi:hypothetical protein
MKVINVRDGQEVRVGELLLMPAVDGSRTRLLAVEEHLFSATGLFDQDGELLRVPLQVRYTHPAFFLQKVAFIPS